jgi:hypothetical protein
MRTWKFVGMFALVLYIVSMGLAFLYNNSYVSDPYSWDLGGIIPLVLINIPGLALYHFTTKIIGTGIRDPTAWIITILILNIILYFSIGALIGFFAERILRKNTEK